MISEQEQILHIQSIPSDRFRRSAASCVVAIGYLLGLFLIQHTWLSVLLLTGIYSSWLLIYHRIWLLIYHFGKQHAHPGWLLALFCLACASLFLPLPSTNVYWLPILPTMTACLMMGTRPRALGLLAAGTLWLSTSLAVGLLTRQWDAGGQIILLISFGSSCGCTATISELVVAHKQLREYSAQVEQLSVIRERNRIAREIHDTLGHSLTLLAVQLETAMQHEMRGDLCLREELREARQVAKDCLTDVRHAVEALRPEEVSSDWLQEQLHRLAAVYQTTSREAQITLDLEESMPPLPPEVCLTLYRCAQEALTNIRKHAHATKVLLRLSTNNEQVELTVLDNGQGYQQGTSGFGLRGMRERVAHLHGTLRAGPEPRHGWRVEAMIPLKPQRQAERSSVYAYATEEKV